MSVMEKNALDMATLLLQAYDIGDMINHSELVAEYWRWKGEVDKHPKVRSLIYKLNDKKEIFSQCERFGHFHPEYHKALDAVKEVEAELDQIEAVTRFKAAENKLDELLYEISQTIAHSVSESIKVPSNNPLPHEGNCASGGSCSGGCG